MATQGKVLFSIQPIPRPETWHASQAKASALRLPTWPLALKQSARYSAVCLEAQKKLARLFQPCQAGFTIQLLVPRAMVR
eukprot:1025253-Pelagomonas_calceolata.AAC.3